MIKPRVCLIGHTYLEKQYRAKLSHLASQVDLTVISPDQFQTPYGLSQADFSEPRNYAVRVYAGLYPAHVRTSTRWVLRSGDLGFRSSPPDIIHVENEATSFSLLQALLYRRIYAPTAKVIVFVWANQQLTGYRRLLLQPLEGFTKSRIDHFIAGNREGKEMLVRSGVLVEQVSVFPLVGLDTSFFKPSNSEERHRLRQELGMEEGDFVVGFVGRFVDQKGIPDLLKAVDHLRANHITQPIRLLCVGDGPLKSELLDNHPWVKVVSPGSGGVLPFYHVIDVLVLPSRTTSYWKEQFGLVLAEAMACGIPVVGSNSGAIPEVVGDAGLVFSEGIVLELVEHLMRLAHDPTLRQELGQKGRDRVNREYSAKSIADKTYQVYQSVLSSVLSR